MAATTSTTVQRNARLFEYPADINTDTGRQQFRLKLQRENPEILFKDCYVGKGKMIPTNLLFHTEHTTAWHAAFCTHFKFHTKKGICKGRQICIFEDTNKESKFLTVNIYQNGTVMVQGNQAALCLFEEAFPTVKELSESEKGSTNQAPRTEPLTSPPTAPQMTPSSDTTHLPAGNTLSPNFNAEVAKLKDSISNIEIGVVELTETVGRYAQDNQTDALKDQLSQVKNQMKASVQEIRRHTENLSQNNEHLQKELAELKCMLKKDFAEIHNEVKREITKLREELYLRDEIIEELKATHTPLIPRPPQTPVLGPAEQRRSQQPTPAAAETTTATTSPGNKQSTTTTTKLDRTAEVAILIDSNGKFLHEQVLFPGLRVSKIWSPKVEDALRYLSDPEFGSPAHIILHTGTNDLRIEQERVGGLIGRLAKKAAESFPTSQVTVSTLLPRKDFHPTTIQRVNADITRDCARLPNVQVAHHCNISTRDLYDQCHLSRRAVGKFAKALKDAALGRQPAADGHTSSQTSPPRSNTTARPHPPPREHHGPTGPIHKPLRPGTKGAHTQHPPSTTRRDSDTPRPPPLMTPPCPRPGPPPTHPAYTPSNPDRQTPTPAHPPPPRANHWRPAPCPRPGPPPPHPAYTPPMPDLQRPMPDHPHPSSANHWPPAPRHHHQHYPDAKPGNHPPTQQPPTPWLHQEHQHAAEPTTLESSYAEVLKGHGAPKMGEIKQMLLYICSKLT